MEDLKSMLRRAQYYKDMYPPGTRIELISMDDPYNPVPNGTKGTVELVDDLGDLHMKWDNGRTLALIPSQDQFRKIHDQMVPSEKTLTERIDQAAIRSAKNGSPSNERKIVQHPEVSHEL